MGFAPFWLAVRKAEQQGSGLWSCWFCVELRPPKGDGQEEEEVEDEEYVARYPGAKAQERGTSGFAP